MPGSPPAARLVGVNSVLGNNGLYGLKPWYAGRLSLIRRRLVAANVSPNVVTASGIAFGCGAGAALALLRPGVLAGVVVAALLAARLACANLDGGVARDGGRSTPFGAVLNELGDRLTELAALAGCLAIAPAWLACATGLAATLPSWVALAGAAAGLGRVQGGPVGKTERCLLLVLLAGTGLVAEFLAIIAIGSAVTAIVRLARIARRARAARAAAGSAGSAAGGATASAVPPRDERVAQVAP
jgi:CDP-diacylglycerol--glycerol-3-phosphate 3-phosphatidyltransferase